MLNVLTIFVHYWKTNEENRNDNQKIQVDKDTFSVEIDVIENTQYSIQINTFEYGTIFQ